jgi:hypothetical protein
LGVLGQNSAREAFTGLSSRPLQRALPGLGLVLGVVLGTASIVTYDRSGYGHGMLLLWLAGLAGLGLFFGSRSRSLPRVARLDLALPAALALILSPLYAIALYRWPVQVSSDEVAIMDVSKTFLTLPDVDPFGTSFYLSRPAMLFVGWGRLGNLLGGVDLQHMRLLHALCGLLVIAASYALFRQLLPRRWAVFAVLLFGVSHSFFMISRLAMRENTAVLAEVVAFALLLWGLRNKHELATFLGGVAAGLGFYVYYPSRAAFPLWVMFLIGLALLFRQRFPLRSLAVLGAIAASGFVLTAAPIVIAESKMPPGAVQPNQETLFVYSQARKLQRDWVFADSEWGGYWKNAKFGVSTFNNRVEDHGWIYENRGHGFVDPLTGILLWIGVGVAGVGIVRRREDDGALLMLGSFLVLWLSYALLINKAPNYTRLLVTLPFVAYLVTEAVRWLARRWRTIPYAPAAIVGSILAVVAVWNLAIAWDFIQKGRRSGDAIGSTARYVFSHRDIPGEKFFISTQDNSAWRYYYFGVPEERVRVFARDPSQVGAAIDPTMLPSFAAAPPFAMFMRRAVWTAYANVLADKYPQGRIRNVTPDGDRVVLEVRSS